MFIVGSRCGGCDFYCSYENVSVWLGAREESDFDVILEDGEERPPGADVIPLFCKPSPENGSLFRGIFFPFLKDEILYIPKSLEFLSHQLKKRLIKTRRPDLLYFFSEKKIDVLAKNGNCVGNFIFKYK